MARFTKKEHAILRDAGRGFRDESMICWLHPVELVRSGIRHVISKLFGAYADRREMQVVLDPNPAPHDYSDRDELWIDYTADTGDGFDSTFTVASALAAETLQVDGHKLDRGSILVLGGDQVYSVASHREYRNRFRMPFAHALPYRGGQPDGDLFAIPGNHDWYDGLTSFLRQFCQERWIGNRKTKQKRSYFALKLPHDIWIWGIDAQIDANMDDPQRKFFVKVAKSMPKGSKVVLVAPVPAWVLPSEDASSNRMLDWFIDRHVTDEGHDLKAVVAGDLHSYCRYEDPKQTQWVMCGGGGAYLYGTAAFPDQTRTPIGSQAKFKRAYPTREKSRSLSWGALLLPFKNIPFTWLLGAQYFLLAWILISAGSRGDDLLRHMQCTELSFGALGGVIWKAWIAILRSPGAVVALAVLVGGLYLFADFKALAKVVAGLLHSAAHLVLCVLLAWASSRLNSGVIGLDDASLWHVLLFIVELVVLGGFLGGVLVGVYLFVSNQFGRHVNEVFVSQSIPHYKSFLRFHLNKNGDLTMYALGIDRACTKWFVQPPDATGHMIHPEGTPIAERVSLVEGPIRIC